MRGRWGGSFSLAVKPTCFQRRSTNLRPLAPLGERVDCNRHFHQVKAGRVRGSKTLGPTETLSTLMPFHFCLLPLLLLLRRTNSILVKTPSPPALRAPLSPTGARGNESLVWCRIRDRAQGEPCPPHGASANLDSSDDLSPATRAVRQRCFILAPMGAGGEGVESRPAS
jgi:hypothetical protein